MKRIVLISLLAVVFVACQDGTSPAGAPFGEANFDFEDGAHNGGNEDFFFLPPLTSSPKGNKVEDRPRNPNLSPVAKMCELNFGDEGAEVPETLECVGGNTGQVANLAMILNADTSYSVNWQTGDPSQTGGAPLLTASHYRIEIFIGNLSLGFRDVDPDPGPPRGNCRGEDFCQFNNGSNVATKVIIESAAVCIALSADFDPDVEPCATASLGANGVLVLPNVGIATVGSVMGASTASLNLQLCDDLRDRDNAGLGKVDIPTFGDCIEIATLEDLTILVSGTATLCAAFNEAKTAVGEDQARRMTVHRFGSLDAGAVALPHFASLIACPTSAPSQALELNSLERFVRFARGTWRAMSDQVRAWIEPAPLFARTTVRCNRGGCSSTTGFRSSFQAATPTWMEAPDGTAFGSHPIGTQLTVKVRALDSGEFNAPESGPTPDPSPLPVEDVRLTFIVTGGTPVTMPSVVPTGDDGIAVFTFEVGPGDNKVEVTGIGVGIAEVADDGNPVNNVFAAPFTGGGEVLLGEPKLTFTATGLVQLSFFDLPTGKNLTVDVPVHIVVCGADPDVSLLVTLGAFNNNGTPQTLVEASPNSGDTPLTVIADGTVSGNTNTVSVPGIAPTGCFDFHVAETKSGGIRFVASAPAATSVTSRRFNVKPAKN